MSMELVAAAIHTTLEPVLVDVAQLLDDVPDKTLEDGPDTGYPMVVMGRIAATTYGPDDAEAGQLMAYQAELEVWSRYHGRKESHAILDLLTAALHRARVAADGIGELFFVLDSSQPVELQADGRTRRSSITFTVRLLTNVEE